MSANDGRVTVRLGTDKHKVLKKLCVDTGLSMDKMINDAIDLMLVVHQGIETDHNVIVSKVKDVQSNIQQGN